MQQEYLLDTNAFFNILKSLGPGVNEQLTMPASISSLLSEKLLISEITKVEIISVIGKYSRGVQGGYQKCNCVINSGGDICNNRKFTPPRKKWKMRITKAWLKLISDIMSGQSPTLHVTIEPFDNNTVSKAQEIIRYALKYNFASMDAMIAATAQIGIINHRNITVITSDKGLKACLSECGIPYNDYFSLNL